MLTFSGWQWSAVIAALQLPELALQVSQGYLLSRSILFGLTSLLLAYGLFVGKSWVPTWLPRLSLILIVWLIAERGIFGQGFASVRLISTAAILLLAWAGLLIALRRPTIQTYYQEHPA